MNKVITINLGGNAYQLEEGGFDALRSYLDAARRRLDGNPDRDEIIADIERAIADKFRSLLSAAKNVVVTVEVTAIIAEMGPVEDGSGSTSSSAGAQAASHAEPGASAADSGGTPPKRLYKIHEGAMAGGVCTGLAAYLNLDVTIVRLLFAILIFVYGAGILLYVLMAILLPSATTSAEKAAAHGTPSATAQEFIRRAREGYYQGMKTMGDRQAHRAWRRRFKSDMREWRRTMKRQMHFSPYTWWHSADPAAGPPPPPPHVWFTDRRLPDEPRHPRRVVRDLFAPHDRRRLRRPPARRHSDVGRRGLRPPRHQVCPVAPQGDAPSVLLLAWSRRARARALHGPAPDVGRDRQQRLLALPNRPRREFSRRRASAVPKTPARHDLVPAMVGAALSRTHAVESGGLNVERPEPERLRAGMSSVTRGHGTVKRAAGLGPMAATSGIAPFNLQLSSFNCMDPSKSNAARSGGSVLI
ncbi:MAG: phage shock protein PspC [Verrucomicrobia bacterium]|nr:phage shock protein PspC [Verrucomicrobiota bacterium]